MAIKGLNCPNCGAGYNPAKLQCEFCGSIVIMSNANQYNIPKEVIEPIRTQIVYSEADVKSPGIYVFGTLLGKGEIPIRLGSANYYVNSFVNKGGKMLLTEKKIYFSSHNFVQSKTDLEIPLENVERVEFDSNMLVSQQISFYENGKRHKFVVYGGHEWIDQILKAKENMSRHSVSQHSSDPMPQNGSQVGNYVDELRQLKRLLDAGIITEEEFAIKKRMLLGI